MSEGGRYRLTEKVRQLGSGYSEMAAIVDAGASIALSLTREIRWPLAIGTLDEDI